jgi:hypothetical protein
MGTVGIITGGWTVGTEVGGAGAKTGGKIDTGADGFCAAAILTDVRREVTKAKPVMHRMCRCLVLIVTLLMC